jgi:hypothetical protein
MLTLINPVPRAEPFDHSDWLFELKFDGVRAPADTVRGRLISRNGDRLRRYEGVLDLLPKGCVFDGELVVLDDAGRPLFKDLLFGRGRPTYVAFDLLMADGVDLRPLPLRERKAALAPGRRWTPTSRASSPSAWPTLTGRSMRAGTRFSIAAIRSVAGALSGFASAGDAGREGQVWLPA